VIERILPDFYRIEIPLPDSPLKALNSYLIKGEERFLLVDTGMNREECLRPMLASLEELGADLKKTDFFITHLHADHLGLVEKLATETSEVFFGNVEARLVTWISKRAEKRFQELFAYYLSNGFPADELKRAVENHPGFRYSLKSPPDFSVLRDGNNIEVGDYTFRCIETPGHSPGHMCLYEANKRILLSGDHILFDITPNITRWPELENSLNAYLASLEKVYKLDVNIVLPGHRAIMSDHRRRIRELREHHKRRLNEVLSAVGEGDKTAWQIAPKITWELDYTSWHRFPPVQKWFAIGETIAHLKYLEAAGKIEGKERYSRTVYSMK
jgi:glyoxylase-like metal-dependent hydrolase (beta-lactamase superfamily II)